MRAVLMTAVGGPEVLEVAEVPEPEVVDARGVRVRLRAAGINPVDYKLRSGGTIGGRLPAVLGWDGAGLVDQVGSEVTRFRPGDEVYFCDGGFGPTPGTYQEAKVLDEAFIARKPSRLSFVEAAAAPLVTITAWEAVVERARVAKGQCVLIQAGAGGVGHMSVQIARIAGARVATTVSGEEKSALAASLGAELLIDYRREDVEEKLREWTGTDGADVVHDTVGGKTFTACFSLVRPYGDLVSNVESPWEEEAIEEMHNRNLRVSFTWMPAPSVFGWHDQRERQRAILERAGEHFDSGRLRVQVGATYPLGRAADAHRALEAGDIVGKAVLTM
ncbi:MAG: zinc-binding dehydrogenase [Solirubrobacteraceae bacterium]